VARLVWRGARVAERMAGAAAAAIDQTMAECVADAKDNHPGFPPASAPYERFHSRTGFTVGSIVVLEAAELTRRAVVSGRWGSLAKDGLFLEIGTSTEGPTAEARALAAHGDMGMITPAVGPLMAPRPFLRPAADRHYPLLAGRIRENFSGDS
jgi:hypothetical protein